MGLEPARARFPFRNGGYESFYLTARHPAEAKALWVRCTVTQAPGGSPEGHRWMTFFESAGPVAIREPGHPSAEGAWIRVGTASFGDGVAGGTAGDAVWNVSFTGTEAPLLYLPSERMYRAGLPRTKPVSLLPHARFTGSLRIGDRVEDLTGWRGMVGHNWGTEHAERWVWVHAILEEDAWIDLVAARVRMAP